MSFLYDIHEVLGQYYVLQVDGFCEERGDVVGGEGSDAASYPGYQVYCGCSAANRMNWSTYGLMASVLPCMVGIA